MKPVGFACGKLTISYLEGWMMGRRDVLFFVLVGGGILALGASLMPPRKSHPMTQADLRIYQEPDFTATLAKVDASFRQQWTAQRLRAAPRAPDLIVARRLALGLMGTIPSLEEIRQLEALPDDQRLPWWIEHVLQDRRYVDNLAERLARVLVGTEDGPFILYRRRRFVAWLADQVAANRPYDQVVRELISSEGLWTDRPATNFVSVTIQQDNQNQPDPVRLTGRVTRAFLGLRLDCAQCHNHPFADWKQAQFQELSAFFGQTHLGLTGVHDGAGEYEVEDRKSGVKRVVAPVTPFAPELLPDKGSRRWRLACWVTDARNPYFSRAAVNRVWAIMLGRPLVDPVDNLEAESEAPPALGLLADDFAQHGFDLRRLARLIASTEVFRMDSASASDAGEAEEKAWAVFPLTRLRPDQVVGSILQASSVATLNAESHILARVIRLGQRNDFVTRYGDTGEDELDGHGGTIPQRLVLMNGQLLREKIQSSPFNASTQVGWMALDDVHAVEAAYLTVLSRRPSAEEAAYFEHFLAESSLSRAERLEDLFWALLNSTELSWSH